MDEEVAVLAMAARSLGQELPAFFAGLAALGGRLELGSCPEDGSFRGAVEAFGVEQRSLIVVAQQDHLAAHHLVDALARVGAVAHDIPQAIDLGDRVLVDVTQHGLECFEITVDVADDGLHAWLSLYGGDTPGLARPPNG